MAFIIWRDFFVCDLRAKADEVVFIMETDSVLCQIRAAAETFGYRKSSDVTLSISIVNFTAYDNSQMIDGKPFAKILGNLTACVKISLFVWYVLTKLTYQDNDRENELEILCVRTLPKLFALCFVLAVFFNVLVIDVQSKPVLY